MAKMRRALFVTLCTIILVTPEAARAYSSIACGKVPSGGYKCVAVHNSPTPDEASKASHILCAVTQGLLDCEHPLVMTFQNSCQSITAPATNTRWHVGFGNDPEAANNDAIANCLHDTPRGTSCSTLITACDVIGASPVQIGNSLTWLPLHPHPALSYPNF